MTRRNEPCHCGSGIKFKKCCLGKVLEVYGPPRPPKTSPVTSGKKDLSPGQKAALISAMCLSARMFR